MLWHGQLNPDEIEIAPWDVTMTRLKIYIYIATSNINHILFPFLFLPFILQNENNENPFIYS